MGDWTSDVYGKLPTQGALEVLKAIDKMLIMGAAMDPAALKAGVQAHSKAIKDWMPRVLPLLQTTLPRMLLLATWLHLCQLPKRWMCTMPLPSSTWAVTLGLT